MKSPNNLKMPSFLQKLQWIFAPVRYMEGAARRYPDLFSAKVVGFGNSSVFVQHPQALQQILTNDRKQFTSPGNLNELLKPLVGSYSIMMLDGDRHRRERKLLMPSFHGERIQGYGQLIEQLTEKVIHQLGVNQPFKALSISQKITIQVIVRMIFKGKRVRQEQKESVLNLV